MFQLCTLKWHLNTNCRLLSVMPHSSNLNFRKVIKVYTNIMQFVSPVFRHVVTAISELCDWHSVIAIELSTTISQPKWLHFKSCLSTWTHFGVCNPNAYYSVVNFELWKCLVEFLNTVINLKLVAPRFLKRNQILKRTISTDF